MPSGSRALALPQDTDTVSKLTPYGSAVTERVVVVVPGYFDKVLPVWAIPAGAWEAWWIKCINGPRRSCLSVSHPWGMLTLGLAM